MKTQLAGGLEQLDFFFPRFRPTQPGEEVLHVGSRVVPLRFIRNDAALRYILRVGNDGAARVTVPRRGTLKAARDFVQRHLHWIEKQLVKHATQPAVPKGWAHGTEILFRGELTRLLVEPQGSGVRLAERFIQCMDTSGDLRPSIERHLRKLATAELVPRVWELASLHQIAISRVTVRNQRSRWGSCSAKKTISLNWRLIQTPAFVRDYIILHELMHLREMNHSSRFWRQVEEVCPDYVKAENWLKQHNGLLRAERR